MLNPTRRAGNDFICFRFNQNSREAVTRSLGFLNFQILPIQTGIEYTSNSVKNQQLQCMAKKIIGTVTSGL